MWDTPEIIQAIESKIKRGCNLAVQQIVVNVKVRMYLAPPVVNVHLLVECVMSFAPHYLFDLRRSADMFT